MRHKLGKETLASHEAKRQQCLGAADVKNFRRYIKAARDKESTFKADIQKMMKRLSAMGLEMSKKDDVTSDMQMRIEELTRMSSEAIKHQDDMRHQNEGLSNVVTELTIGDSPFSHHFQLASSHPPDHTGFESSHLDPCLPPPPLSPPSPALEAACETELQLRSQCQSLQKANTASHEQIAQIQSIMTFQRNEAQSTKNLLAREKAMRKQAERNAQIASQVAPGSIKQSVNSLQPPPKLFEGDEGSEVSVAE